MANSTFATARNLGFLNRGGVRPLQVKDSLGGANQTDIFKFSIRPGPGLRVRSSFQNQGGKMDFSFFIKDPRSGQIMKLTGPKRVAGAGSSDILIKGAPPGAPALDCYVKFDRPMQNVKYQFKITSL